MARGLLLSVLALYKHDNTIFDSFVLPDEVDKEVLINNILLESAELEVLFTNPDTLKFAIGEWSKRRLQAWTRISSVLYEDYDPFVNIKRDEERTITQTRNLANTLNSNINTSNEDETVTSINEEGENNSTTNTIHNVNGWDDNSATGVQRDTTNTVVSETNENTQNGTSSNSGNSESTRSDRGTDTGTITTHEKYHVEGDSAITDAQDVLKKEVQARQDLNIYNFIIKEFIERFCLLVY